MVQRASSVSSRGAARGLEKMKDEDDSGDEAEARHLLEKRRTHEEGRPQSQQGFRRAPGIRARSTATWSATAATRTSRTIRRGGFRNSVSPYTYYKAHEHPFCNKRARSPGRRPIWVASRPFFAYTPLINKKSLDKKLDPQTPNFLEKSLTLKKRPF